MKMIRYCACKSSEIGPSDCIGENQMSQTCYEGHCPSDDGMFIIAEYINQSSNSKSSISISSQMY